MSKTKKSKTSANAGVSVSLTSKFDWTPSPIKKSHRLGAIISENGTERETHSPGARMRIKSNCKSFIVITPSDGKNFTRDDCLASAQLFIDRAAELAI